MSKNNPKNREEAFSYQFESDVKNLLALSKLIDEYGDNKESFKSRLNILKSHIKTYEIIENMDKYNRGKK